MQRTIKRYVVFEKKAKAYWSEDGFTTDLDKATLMSEDAANKKCLAFKDPESSKGEGAAKPLPLPVLTKKEAREAQAALKLFEDKVRALRPKGTLEINVKALTVLPVNLTLELQKK